MNAAGTVAVIARRELRERVAKKGTIIGTAVMMAVVVAGVVLPGVLGGDGAGETTLGVVGDAPADLESSLVVYLPEDRALAVRSLPSRDAAEAALEEGEVDAVLLERRELLVDGWPDAALHAGIEAVLRADAMLTGLADAGLSEEQTAAVLTPPAPLQIVDVSGDAGGGTSFVIAALATVLLLVGVQMSGATLLSGALEEKSSRVVEILVSAARPWHLLAGKVLATSVLTFVQLALIVGAGLAANRAVDAFTLPEATGSLLFTTAAMLLAGFLFYAALFTVAGTLAATVEDAQSTAGPLYVAMFGAYFAVFAAVIPNPSGIVSQVLTFLPPTAPFVVPARVGLGAIETWQVVVSVVVTLLGALGALRLAGRIYAASLLSGGRLSWRAAWRAEPVR